MIAALEKLKATMSGLPLLKRAELVHHLLRTLEPDEEGAADEWLALADRLMAEVRAGRVVGIPAERSVWVFAQVGSIRDRELWEDLKSLVVVWRGRKVAEEPGGEPSYYISSRLAGGEAVRGRDARPLGDRERVPLGAGRGLPRGPVPRARGERCGELR